MLLVRTPLQGTSCEHFCSHLVDFSHWDRGLPSRSFSCQFTATEHRIIDSFPPQPVPWHTAGVTDIIITGGAWNLALSRLLKMGQIAKVKSLKTGVGKNCRGSDDDSSACGQNRAAPCSPTCVGSSWSSGHSTYSIQWRSLLLGMAVLLSMMQSTTVYSVGG